MRPPPLLPCLVLTAASLGTAGAAWVAVKPLSDVPVRQFAGPRFIIDPSRSYRATLVTSKGKVTLELDPKVAPVAVNSFVFLALNHFYDGTPFHRVVEGFVAQGGDPGGSGSGGPGYSFYTEADPALKFDAAGVLGMARSQSTSSNGSQFFITLAPASFLNGQYTVFGRVTAGQEVVDALQKTGSSATPDTLLGVSVEVGDGAK